MTFSIWQFAIVLVIAVAVFGPKRFRAVAQSVRTGANELKNSITRKFDEDVRVEPVKLENVTTAAGPDAEGEQVDGRLVDQRR